MTEPKALVAELRGFADGSTSARATLMRDAADAIEGLLSEMQNRELHHFETEALLTQAGLNPDAQPEWEYGHTCDQIQSWQSGALPVAPSDDCTNVTLLRRAKRSKPGEWQPVPVHAVGSAS